MHRGAFWQLVQGSVVSRPVLLPLETRAMWVWGCTRVPHTIRSGCRVGWNLCVLPAGSEADPSPGQREWSVEETPTLDSGKGLSYVPLGHLGTGTPWSSLLGEGRATNTQHRHVSLFLPHGPISRVFLPAAQWMGQDPACTILPLPA